MPYGSFTCTGVGKSAIILDYLAQAEASEERGVLPVTLTFSAQTTSKKTQETIESKLFRSGFLADAPIRLENVVFFPRRRNRLGAPKGKRMVIFVDDVNMPVRSASVFHTRTLIGCSGIVAHVR